MLDFIREDDEVLVIEDDGRVLEVEPGFNGRLWLDGKEIPRARFWRIAMDHLEATPGAPIPRSWMLAEAVRAEIFRTEVIDTALMAEETRIRDSDQQISGSVYWRTQPMRIRPLLEPGMVIGKVQRELLQDVELLFNAMREGLGLVPIAAKDNKYIFGTAAQREVLYQRFGTRDWMRLAVYLLRPGSSSKDLWFDLFVLPGDSNDGTVAITSQVHEPMQGTYHGDGDCLAKGIVRPPLHRVEYRREGKRVIREVVEREEVALFDCAAFGREMDLRGRFYRVGTLGRERCRLNYQTALFSLLDPAWAISMDTARLVSGSVLDLLSRDDRRKVTAGVPAGLCMPNVAPWQLLTRMVVPGVRATVFGSELVPQGCMALLPQTARELNRLYKKYTGESLERGMEFVVHRDPAMADGSSMASFTYDGELQWAGQEGEGYGIVLHPRDPHWKRAGGDFDGDSASVFLPFTWLHPRGTDAQESYRCEPPKDGPEDPGEQMLRQAKLGLTQLLGPIVLAATKLAERGLDTPTTRKVASAVAQASVDAKKHYVDPERTMEGARLIFGLARDGADQDGEYLITLINQLKQAPGDRAKAEAWDRIVEWRPGSGGCSEVERAMMERIQVLNQWYRDAGFLRNARIEMPNALRTAATDRSSGSERGVIYALTQRYNELMRELLSLRDEADDEEMPTEGLEVRVREDLRRVREEFRYAMLKGKGMQAAMVALGPARLAAQLVPAAVFEGLGLEAREVIVNLIGHEWGDGRYAKEELRPIPNCRKDVELVMKGTTHAWVTVLHRAPNSTRVNLRVAGAAGAAQ